MIVRRETDDLGSGIRRVYFSERAPRRRLPAVSQPPRIDKRDPCPRRSLARIVDASPESYAGLSRMLGKSDGFLRRFVVEGVPAALLPDDHRRLADFFGVDERALGVRDLWKARRANV